MMYNSIVHHNGDKVTKMVNIGISEFRANLNAVLKKVQQGEIVRLTARGVEVARLIPPNLGQTLARQELERLRSTALIGDVLSPIDESWDATA
jgi:prevent-host-death family protein